MADFCPFCLSPNAENLDTLVAYAANGFPSAVVPLVQAAVIPLQQSHEAAVERGARLASLALPPILSVRLRLYGCPGCELRYRIAQIPIDVLYRHSTLRDKFAKRIAPPRFP